MISNKLQLGIRFLKIPLVFLEIISHEISSHIHWKISSEVAFTSSSDQHFRFIIYFLPYMYYSYQWMCTLLYDTQVLCIYDCARIWLHQKYGGIAVEVKIQNHLLFSWFTLYLSLFIIYLCRVRPEVLRTWVSELS